MATWIRSVHLAASCMQHHIDRGETSTPQTIVPSPRQSLRQRFHNDPEFCSQLLCLQQKPICHVFPQRFRLCVSPNDHSDDCGSVHRCGALSALRTHHVVEESEDLDLRYLDIFASSCFPSSKHER